MVLQVNIAQITNFLHSWVNRELSSIICLEGHRQDEKVLKIANLMKCIDPNNKKNKI
jgi:hypothetical protein